ncbi:MAG TPA: hypothetical protein ENJ02_08225 [Chloroflexi bacterium]|nr:hypothetical protein [Chloroflexota bacterium]
MGLGTRDWGLGTRDWGLGEGERAGSVPYPVRCTPDTYSTSRSVTMSLRRPATKRTVEMVRP